MSADLPWGEDGPVYTKADAITAEKLADVDEREPIDPEDMCNAELAEQIHRISFIFDPGHRNYAFLVEAFDRLNSTPDRIGS